MGTILVLLLEVFSWGLIIYCILSFISLPQFAQVSKALHTFYEPFLDPIKRLLKPLQGNMPLDFSPIVLILLIEVIKKPFLLL